MELFIDVFGPEKSKYLFTQYPSVDIYGNRRFIDFALESDSIKIAIEMDGLTINLKISQIKLKMRWLLF